MKKALSVTNKKGSSLIEALLAVAVFGLFVSAIVGGLIYGQESTVLAGQRQRATKIADECEEAARSIRDSGYTNLVNGTYGLTSTGGHWALTGASDVTDIFTRSITVADGSIDQKIITCNVNWAQNRQRSGNVQLVTYLTNWKTTILSSSQKGMLVFGDGGNSTDAIKYQIYDDNTGTWSVAANTADVDTSTSNKYVRSVEIFSSATRNEKVLVTRHYNGTRAWFYAQVFNGTTNTWGNVNLLSNFATTTNLDIQRFDGTYLANGDFVVLYSDNTAVPKFKVWNGTAWSSASGVVGKSTPSIGGIPSYITLKQRPGTNEAMAVIFDQSSDTNSLYFWIGANNTYETADWVLSVEHSNQAPLTTKKFADFEWSSTDATKGAMIYTNRSSDKQMDLKIWTADGFGSGAWSSATEYPTAQISNIGALSITAVKGTDNFIACNKDADSTPRYICMRADNSGWVSSSNTTVSAVTDPGVQISYGLGFEQTTSQYGISPFSDNTGILKYKKYTRASNAWDSTATNVNTVAVGTIETVRVIPNPNSDDLMIFAGDSSLDVYSVIFDGTNNSFYNTPAGKAWLVHGLNGSDVTDYWYDFVWDGM